MQPINNFTKDGVAELFALLMGQPELRDHKQLPQSPGESISTPLLDGGLFTVTAHVRKTYRGYIFVLDRHFYGDDMPEAGSIFENDKIEEMLRFSLSDFQSVRGFDVDPDKLKAEAMIVKGLRNADRFFNRLQAAADRNHAYEILQEKCADMSLNHMLEFVTTPVFAPPQPVRRERRVSPDGHTVDVIYPQFRRLG